MLIAFLSRCLVRVIEKLKGFITQQRAFDVQLLDSFAAASLQELDYLNEAANQVGYHEKSYCGKVLKKGLEWS